MKNRHASRKYRPIIASESMIVNQCIRWLYDNRLFFYRNNTGAYKPEGSGRFIRYGFPGSSDIVGIIQGRYIAIEAKTERGKQSDKQKAFQERVEASGGVYLLVHSLDELIEAMKPLLVPF